MRRSSSLRVYIGNTQIPSRLAPFFRRVLRSMRYQPVTAHEGLKMENNSMTGSEDVIYTDHRKLSSKDYSWDPSNGVRFASNQKQGKDLTWRPDYGIILKHDTHIYSKKSLHRKALGSRQTSCNESSDNERDHLERALSSCNVATLLDKRRKKSSRKFKAKDLMPADKPTYPRTRINEVPQPKKLVGGATCEELAIFKVPAGVGFQEKDLQGPKTDLEMGNDPGDCKQPREETVKNLRVMPVLKNVAGIHDRYTEMRNVTNMIKETHYECKLLAGRLLPYQWRRIKALRVPDKDWEAISVNMDSNLSQFNDIQARFHITERCSGTIEALSHSRANFIVVLNSLSHILLDFMDLCFRIKNLCWRIKKQRHIKKTYYSIIDTRLLLINDFSALRNEAHNMRQLFYARPLSFVWRIKVLKAQYKNNIKEILENLEYIISTRSYGSLEYGKLRREKFNSEIMITGKNKNFQMLEQIYLELKNSDKSIYELLFKESTYRLHQLWLLRNGSVEAAFLEWHVLPFRKLFQSFHHVKRMIFALNTSITQTNQLHKLVKSRKDKRLLEFLKSICKVFDEMGYINHFYSRPVFQSLILALNRTVQGKTKIMLQSRLETLKMAKQKRQLVSNGSLDIHHSDTSKHSLRYRSIIKNQDASKTSTAAALAKDLLIVGESMQVSTKTSPESSFSSKTKVKKRQIKLPVGTDHDADGNINVPSKDKNIHCIKNSLSTKFNADSVNKVPPTMTLNIKPDLQMRGMHTSCIDHLSNDMTAGAQELHGNYNSNHKVSTVTAAQLQYQIPTSVLQSGMRASPQTPAAYWSYDLYRNYSNDRVKLHYCVTKRSVEAVCKYFLDQHVLGFDMEWDVQGRSGFKNKVSLVQLASEDRIALFHVSLFEDEDVHADSLPTLKAIMESKNIIKAGVSIKGDCTRLRKNIGIDARGLIELSHLHNLVKYSSTQPERVSKRAVALAVQVEEHLQLPLHKGDVRESDWTQRLSAEQMIYAASDAYAGYRLFYVLEEKRLKLHPVPPRPAYADLGLPIRLAEESDANGCKTLNEGSDNVDERTLSTNELTNAVPLMISDATETRGYSVSSTYSVASAENGSSLSTSLQNARHETSNRGKARFSDCPEIKEAEAWIEKWRAGRSSSVTPRTSAANLRVYALWYGQSLELCRIASMLRDPPLQLSTVSCYLLDCLKTEKLPFDESRIQDVIKLIPKFLVHGKYKHFLQRARLTGSDFR